MGRAGGEPHTGTTLNTAPSRAVSHILHELQAHNCGAEMTYVLKDKHGMYEFSLSPSDYKTQEAGSVSVCLCVCVSVCLCACVSVCLCACVPVPMCL